MDENLVQLCWHDSDAVGGVHISVADDDLDVAIPIYQDHMSSLRNECYPLNPVRAWPVGAFFPIVFGIPLILFGRILNKSE